MNEKPILFSAAMVLAILEGRKTQTRRVINPQPCEWAERFEPAPFKGYGIEGGGWIQMTKDEYKQLGMAHCRYGKPGDRLWVRETWKCEELSPSGEDGVRFRADNAFVMIENTREASDRWCDARREYGKWRPSIFMPRWASRIDLKVLNVRVERVQKITRDDAKAEGVSPVWSYDGKKDPSYFERSVLNPYVANYSVLWDEINGKRGFGWDVNPWVWVVEFKVV